MYFHFRISGQFFIHESCHYSTSNHDIDIKLGPATKIATRNTATSKKIDDDVTSTNCDVTVFFLIDGQFAAIRKPDFGRMVYKLKFSLIVNLYLTKPENKTKKSLTKLSYYCFE